MAKIEPANLLLTDKNGNTGLVKSLTNKDITTLKGVVTNVDYIKDYMNTNNITLPVQGDIHLTATDEEGNNTKNLVLKANGAIYWAGNQIRPAINDIGIPGELGFGVGICPYSDEKLLASGWTPMPGYDDINSDNYGNYLHNRAGQFVWIPKFYVRYGDNRSPKYSTYKANTIEVTSCNNFKNTAEAEAAGWTLPEAFINAGKEVEGFMIGKWVGESATLEGKTCLVSKGTGYAVNITAPVMIDYCKVTGSQFNPTRSHMIVAVWDFITRAQQQNATNTTNCAWYDYTYAQCKPRLNRNNANLGLYSHNGQKNGVADATLIWQMCPDVTTAGTSATQGQTQVKENYLYIIKRSIDFKDITSGFGGPTDAWGTSTSLLTNHDKIPVDFPLTTSWYGELGNGDNPIYTDLDTDNHKRLHGIIARNSNAISSAGLNLYKGRQYYNPVTQCMAYYMCGQNINVDCESSFSRHFTLWRSLSDAHCGCRLASYVL